MKKKVIQDNAYYAIGWSKLYKYDRIMAARILPELPGILFIFENKGGRMQNLLCFACWRDGLRMGMKLLLDPVFSSQPHLMKKLQDKELWYKYCIVDSSPKDMQDVMFWLIKSYSPQFNNVSDFEDSKRYTEICVNELKLNNSQVELHVPGM